MTVESTEATEPAEPDTELEQAADIEAGTPIIVEKTNDELLAEYDQETARIVGEKVAEVDGLESEWIALHANASAAKKRYEIERDELLKLIRARRENRGKPEQKDLFSDVKSGQPVEQMDPEFWRLYPISFDRWERWGVTEKDIEKLNSGETKHHGTHPIATMGDLQRYVSPEPNNPSFTRQLSDIKGFGPKGAERWSDAEQKFWAWWGNAGEAEFCIEKGLTRGNQSQPGASGTDQPDGDQSADDEADADSTGGQAEDREEAANPKRKRKATA